MSVVETHKVAILISNVAGVEEVRTLLATILSAHVLDCLGIFANRYSALKDVNAKFDSLEESHQISVRHYY